MPARGAVIGFITFIASMISRVSPSLTLRAGGDERRAPGSPARKTVPTIGDLTAPGWLAGVGLGGAAPAAAAAAAGGRRGRGAARRRRRRRACA